MHVTNIAKHEIMCANRVLKEGHQWLPSVPKYQHQYKAHSSKDNSTDAEENSKSKGNPRYNMNDSCRWLWHTISVCKLIVHTVRKCR